MTRNRLVLFTLIASIVGVISRCFQLFSMTEANTGFILKQYSAFGLAITIFIFILILSVCLAASLTKTKGLKNGVSYPLIAASILAAIAVIIEPITLNYYKTLSTTVRGVCIILSLAFAVVMVLFAFSKTGKLKFNNVYLCIPVFCQFMRLVLAFMSTSKIVTVSDNVYELGFLCAAVMFLVYFAQCYTNSGNEKTPTKMLVTGLCAFSFAVVWSIPKIITLVVGKPDLFYNSTTSVFANLALGMFIFFAALEVEE